MDLTIDRTYIYKGIEYRVVENLNSNTLLVVKKEEYDKGKFPIQTYIIPDEGEL